MKSQHLIWDLPLRLFHWLLVLTFIALWASAEMGSEYMQYHMYAGYFMLFLLTFRVVWGIAGTKHAQFLSFFPTPARLKAYLKPSENIAKREPAGHNPLGAMMVFAMILLLFTQAVSGLFITDDVFSSGPYYGSVGGDLETLFNRLHDICFTLIQACIALHLVALAFYKFTKKKSLVQAMFTGKKSSADVKKEDAINSSKLVTAIVLAIIVAVFVYWLVVINAPVIEDYYYY
ncbi:cytochrome b/b6 domain-containing protein [Catenovulum sp. SM1970]|uniref:cytochrome b/b6 domain-containing protein n=1 Tax=Marinifaba aquimaris TaxID=2741323 RepID=UPI00157485F0|nr:cytochrome b/b6 domain-containing protein [Marinifaba aquimaris]NTS78369.1 cytochrome b/b6 domain-containing protein [Marinifaba aquimaris]